MKINKNIFNYRNLTEHTSYLACFLFLFFLTYVPPTVTGYSSNTIYSIYTYVILCVLLVSLSTIILFKYKFSIERLKIQIDKIIVLKFYLLMFFMLFSSLLNPNSFRQLSVIVLWNSMVFIVLFLIFKFLIIERTNKILIFSKAVILFGLISVVLAILSFFYGRLSLGPIEIIQNLNYPRLHGWFGNPNRSGSIFAICAILISYIWCNVCRPLKFICFAIFFLLVLGLILSGSRGALLAFITSLTTFVFFVNLKKYRLKKTWLKLYGAFLGITIFIIVGYDLFDFQREFYSVFQRSRSLERINIWQDVISLSSDTSIVNLLFGHGYGYIPSNLGSTAHNGYLQWFVEYGLIFTVVMVLLIVYVFIIIIREIIRGRNIKDNSLLLSILVFLTIRDLFTHSILQVRFEGFIFLALLFFSSQINKKRVSS